MKFNFKHKFLTRSHAVSYVRICFQREPPAARLIAALRHDFPRQHTHTEVKVHTRARGSPESMPVLLSLSLRSAGGAASRGLAAAKLRSSLATYRSLAANVGSSVSTPKPVCQVLGVYVPDMSWSCHYSIEASSSQDPRMMPFQDYRKLKRTLKWRTRIAGIPMGLAGIMFSSYLNVQLNPSMLAATPEEVQPVLYVGVTILLSFTCV